MHTCGKTLMALVVLPTVEYAVDKTKTLLDTLKDNSNPQIVLSKVVGSVLEIAQYSYNAKSFHDLDDFYNDIYEADFLYHVFKNDNNKLAKAIINLMEKCFNDNDETVMALIFNFETIAISMAYDIFNFVSHMSMANMKTSDVLLGINVVIGENNAIKLFYMFK